MEEWYGRNAGYSKPGCQNVTLRRHWFPEMQALYVKKSDNCSFVTQLMFDTITNVQFGTPETMYVNITVPLKSDNYTQNAFFLEVLWYVL